MAATELGASGVKVNRICPGGIITPIFADAVGHPEEAAKVMAALETAFAGVQPSRRPGLPLDIANAALWLASDESSFVNGLSLVVDGGATRGGQWTATVENMKALNELL